MGTAATSGTLPARDDSCTAKLRAVHPTHDLAALIGDDLDVNEHRRNQLSRLREQVIGDVATRRLDLAIGAYASAHRQLSRALREVEAAGGAA